MRTRTPPQASKADPFAVVYAYVKSTRPYEVSPWEALSPQVPNESRNPYEKLGRPEVPKQVSRAFDQLSVGQLQRITALARRKREQQEEVLSRRGLREEAVRELSDTL